MDDYEFERAFVGALIQIIEGRELKHDAVAKAAWPWRKAAGRTWQSMRNNDPPQRMTLRDAFGMAQELGLPMTSLCGMVEGMAALEAAGKQQGDIIKKEGCAPPQGHASRSASSLGNGSGNGY